MEDKQQQEKREVRRRRRIRNQVLSYMVLIVLIIAAAAGIVLGVQQITRIREAAEEASRDSQQRLEDLLASEDVISTPGPTEEPVVELTPKQQLDELVDAAIAVMSLEDKVAGIFIVTPEAITGVTTAVRAGESTRDALARYPVGGLIYFAKNIQSETQLGEMLGNTASYAKYPLFLAVDEEGGSVARVASAGIGEKVPSAEELGATEDPANAYQAGVTIGATLSGLGFNLDFAPVADLANVPGSIMKGRSYGSEAGVVSEFVISMVTGLKEQGVTSCLKHFPGIGSSTEDTHNGMASTDRSLDQFWAEELAVFQAGIDAGADMIMVSHMSAPSLTGDNEPCIFSRALVTDILRNQMNFQGVIITDALNMEAISSYYGTEEAACMAVLAGCDMLLMPEDFERAYNAVLEAVQKGEISEQRIDDSLRRIYRIKYAHMIQ